MRSPIKYLFILFCFFIMSHVVAKEPVRVIVFGAHPDDCEMSVGGTAALFAKMGHKVKFVSLTNGDKGHHSMKPEDLAKRRKNEMKESAKILNVIYENLENHDGELMPSMENRKEVIKMICDWKADIVITHRPNDYHPDHRYTSILVQDAAYMISVPLMLKDGNAMLKTPLFLYVEDSFKKPNSFSPDIVIDITSVTEKKIDAICAHESQVFEWLPWNGGYEREIGIDSFSRRKMAIKHFLGTKVSEKDIDAISRWYSPNKIKDIRYIESFEICEYGSNPNQEEIKELFPMLLEQ